MVPFMLNLMINLRGEWPTKLIPAGCVLLRVLYFGRLRPHSPMYPCGCTWPLAANSIPYDSWGTIQTMMATPIQGTKNCNFRCPYFLINSSHCPYFSFFYSLWLGLTRYKVINYCNAVLFSVMRTLTRNEDSNTFFFKFSNSVTVTTRCVPPLFCVILCT